MLDKFADELREQREKSGLTLQQMATKTRIDIKFLEAIDQGNFAFLPDLYVKAFVKQYSKTIGLDESLIIKKFEAAREGKEYNPDLPLIEEEPKQKETPKTEPPKTEAPKQTVKSSSPLITYVDEQKQKSTEDESKTNKQLMIFGLGGVGLIVISALIYFFVFNKSDKIIVEETPIENVIEQSNQRYVEEEPADQIVSDSTVIPVSSDSLYLTFFAKDTSWVFVVLDNNRTQEFTLYPNSRFSIAASREFKATVGNSGGVTLQLNNQAVDFTGRAGSVRHFKLDKNGIVYLTTPPKLEQQ
jgi:transcriptional regulator with XRE-family HTH domain